jgi:hypothetical protein
MHCPENISTFNHFVKMLQDRRMALFELQDSELSETEKSDRRLSAILLPVKTNGQFPVALHSGSWNSTSPRGRLSMRRTVIQASLTASVFAQPKSKVTVYGLHGQVSIRWPSSGKLFPLPLLHRVPGALYLAIKRPKLTTHLYFLHTPLWHVLRQRRHAAPSILFWAMTAEQLTATRRVSWEKVRRDFKRHLVQCRPTTGCQLAQSNTTAETTSHLLVSFVRIPGLRLTQPSCPPTFATLNTDNLATRTCGS